MTLAPYKTGITLEQWFQKRDAWASATIELVRLWFESELGTQAELARHLGLSRAAIGKHVKTLRIQGCESVPAATGQGKRTDLEVNQVDIEVVNVTPAEQQSEPALQTRPRGLQNLVMPSLPGDNAAPFTPKPAVKFAKTAPPPAIDVDSVFATTDQLVGAAREHMKLSSEARALMEEKIELLEKELQQTRHQAHNNYLKRRAADDQRDKLLAENCELRHRISELEAAAAERL